MRLQDFLFWDTCIYARKQKKIKKKKKEEVQEKDIQDDEEEVECTRTRGNPVTRLRASTEMRLPREHSSCFMNMLSLLLMMMLHYLANSRENETAAVMVAPNFWVCCLSVENLLLLRLI